MHALYWRFFHTLWAIGTALLLSLALFLPPSVLSTNEASTRWVLFATAGGPFINYGELRYAHEGLSENDSDMFKSLLTLIQCNHIGDRNVLRQALSAALQTEAEFPQVQSPDVPVSIEQV